MLNESLAPRDILSEGLKYHMDANKPLTEHLYRAGSNSYFNLWAEARSLYSRNILEITHEDDLAVLTETDLGHFGLYETVNFEGEEYDIISKDGDWVYLRSIYDTQVGRKEIKVKEKDITINETKVPLDFPIEINEIEDENFVKGIELLRSTLSKEGGAAGLEPLVKALSGLGFSKDEVVDLIKKNINIKQHRDGDYILLPLEEATRQELGMSSSVSKSRAKAALKNPSNDGSKVYGLDKDGKRVELKSINDVDKYKKFEIDADLNEAKNDNKKLNKPMRDSSGGKAYKVYVKDPKTGNIKTVRFGSGGLRAKINDKKARNAFAKRHKCSEKTDKTKASYWSCRLPRYAKLLGLKSTFTGFW
jgi:hypothetical protein